MNKSRLFCLIILAASCKESRSEEVFGGESKVDAARAATKKYAFEAYPSWSAAHPEKSCPNSLEELNEYMNSKDTKDPWGGQFKMLCGQNLPTGAKGLAVISPGEDGKEGTSDDVKSWE